MILFAQNSQYIEAAGLKNQAVSPAIYVNDAVLTATLKTKAGAAVPGATAMTGAYVAGSNGTYHFSLDPTQFNPLSGLYTLVIDGTADGGAFHAEIAVVVKVRNEGTES